MRNATIRTLLACGILSPLFYASIDAIGGTRWQHYSWISEEFSRLSAIGAPSRPVLLMLNPFFTVLVVAFGLGVWWAAGQRRALRVIGGALVVWAAVNFAWPQFFPEDLSASVSALTNTMHIVITGVTVASWMLMLALGAFAFGRWFRLYSISEVGILLVFDGVLAGSQASALAAGQPTPWLGLVERVGIYSFYLWMVGLALVLLHAHCDRASIDDVPRRDLARPNQAGEGR